MINLIELLDKVKTRSLELPLKFDGTKSSEGKLRFMKKHKVEVTPDANGNGDDVFKASNIGHPEDHGYNRPKGEDAKVYEEVESSDLTNRLTTIATVAATIASKIKAQRAAQIGPTKPTGNGGVGPDTRRYPAGTLKNSYEPEGNQIDEISNRLKADYIKAASHDIVARSAMTRDFDVLSAQQKKAGQRKAADYSGGIANTIFAKIQKRQKFMALGADQLASEPAGTLKNSYEPEGNQIDEYNLNKSMGLFAYINYYVESRNSVISDFSIKDRIKLAFTDFFSETKAKQ